MENSPKIPETNSKEIDYQRRGIALEANQLHGKKLPPERIGQALLAADLEAESPEQRSKKVATMSRSELLDMSQEINIDNTTLRHIYDTHLIGENGLRRLVYEHLRGGNLHEALRHEILERERDFERDPQLRRQLQRPDRQPKSLHLKDLLAKTGIVETNNGRYQPADAKPPVRREHLEQQLTQQARQRKLLDFAFLGIILILMILVILLALSRR